ncbi:hypothetical protein V9T40_006645 [Parthenolecanium corni]|uniref:Odorant receptor n=1 Tax=Parthenolecanium corni TaxID=536013 RepID=A0AAN9TTM8_9HEMI
MAVIQVQARRGYLVQTLRIGTLMLGIAIEPELKLTEIIYTVLLLLGFILVGVFALIDFLFILKNGERIEAMYTANASFAVLSIFLMTKFRKAPWLRLCRQILNDYQSSDFARISEEIFLKVVRKYRGAIITIYFSVILLPLVILFSTDVKAGENKSLIFPSWYPWNMSTRVGYFFTMIVQLLSVTSGYGIVAAILACLFCSIVCIFTHVRLLEQRLHRLCVVAVDAKSKNKSMLKHSVTSDDNVRQTIFELVEQHRILMR